MNTRPQAFWHSGSPSGVAEVLAGNDPWLGGALLLLAFCIPLLPGASWFLALAVLITLIVRSVQGCPDHRFRRPGLGSPAFWVIAFYLLHVVGMLWSSNLDFGLFDLEIKTPLLVFALIACLHGRLAKDRNGLLFAFVLGGGTSVVGHIAAALVRVASGSTLGAFSEFYSSTFSSPLHPSYLALYLCVALAVWYLTRIHEAVPAWLDLLALLILCAGIVLSGSKAGWIVLVLLLPLLLIWRWQVKRTRSILLFATGATALLVAGLLAVLPNARERVVEAWHAATEEQHAADASTSSEVRWVTWSAAWTLFKEAPVLGTGTGDIKDELLKVYEERGNTYALERRLNAHDQFLQSAACLGLPGLVTLLAMVLLPVFKPSASGRLAVVVCVIWLVNLLVESMLEVQAGTVFFGFTLLVLFSGVNNEASN